MGKREASRSETGPRQTRTRRQPMKAEKGTSKGWTRGKNKDRTLTGVKRNEQRLPQSNQREECSDWVVEV